MRFFDRERLVSALPIELAHYTAWAERLQAGLTLAYPRTRWLVLDQDGIIRLPLAGEVLRSRWFHVMAMTQDGSRHIWANVPFTRIVDEEAFALVVVALGRELERRLSPMVGRGEEDRSDE